MPNNLTTTQQTQPLVAYLREMIPGQDGHKVLHQAQISFQSAYENFAEFADDFWRYASFPRTQSSKFETFSWSPTFYSDSLWRPKSKPDAAPKHGTWRVGEAAVDHVTVGYFDLDNHRPERSMVSLDEIASILEALGLSYMLYTSYSHTTAKHKVRIIVPINRDATWQEMGDIFARLNVYFDYQLDGSIYDPGDHLYGPTFGGERREWFGGGSLDVDAALALELTEEAQAYAQRNDETVRTRREWSPEEVATYKAKIADETVAMNISIENPKVFNPDWFDLIDRCYNGGSHRQTLLGIMSKVWLKSKGELSFGEMRTIQQEIDSRWNCYCASHYGRGALESDLRSAMTLTVTPTTSPQDDFQARVEANLKRIQRRSKHSK